MIQCLLALVFIAVAFAAIALQKTYAAVPAKELRRQAQGADELAKMLYRAVAYEGSLQALLWTVAVGSMAASFVVLSTVAPALLVFALEAVVLAYALAWIPGSDVTRFGLRLAIWCTPSVVWVLSRAYPLLLHLVGLIRRHRVVSTHTGLYEPNDLLDLLERQRQQPDSRMSDTTLIHAVHALTFTDKTVADILIPKQAVKTVSQEDTVGPILMKELHDSGLESFPVHNTDGQDIVGILLLHDAVNAKEGGKIAAIMQPKVHFVHEEYTLAQMLHAFLKTKTPVFVVLNRFGEYVGIATVADMITQMLGQKVTAPFDSYDDARAVVEHQARTEQTAPAAPVAPQD